MLFDEAMTAGQVLALYHGACVAGQVCNRGRPGCTEGQKTLSCMESAEHTSGLQIGDQVEHHWDSMLPDFCHSTPTVGSFGAVTNADPPDPMLARGTVCSWRRWGCFCARLRISARCFRLIPKRSIVQAFR